LACGAKQSRALRNNRALIALLERRRLARRTTSGHDSRRPPALSRGRPPPIRSLDLRSTRCRWRLITCC